MKIISKDLKDFKKHIENEFPKKMNKVISRYENNMAFSVKDAMPFAINKTMHIKQRRSIAFMNKAVMVEKSKVRSKNGASVGSLQYDKQRKNYGRYMLERMFFGEKLKQAGKSGAFRKNIYVGKKKLNMRMMKNSVRLPKNITTKNKRQQIAIGAKLAKRKGKKILFLNSSILSLKNTSSKKIIDIKKSGSIKTKKINWFDPALNKALNNKEMIAYDTLQRELNKK